ncbi:MAG: hypothetical protein J6Z01_02810, partial [Bacteroidales bacterium]|nr:hypothetical protein [Bacteroidales bacterium]
FGLNHINNLCRKGRDFSRNKNGIFGTIPPGGGISFFKTKIQTNENEYKRIFMFIQLNHNV